MTELLKIIEENKKQIAKRFQNLQSQKRAVRIFTLRVQGKTYEEITKIENVRLNTVSYYVNKMKDLLIDEFTMDIERMISRYTKGLEVLITSAKEDLAKAKTIKERNLIRKELLQLYNSYADSFWRTKKGENIPTEDSPVKVLRAEIKKITESMEKQ